MFKFGICSLKELNSIALDGFINKRKCLALDLYNLVGELPEGKRDEIEERILQRVSNDDGTFRFTYAHRFRAFDALTVSSITSNFPVSSSIRVHDIGVSDGRTSYELYDRLHRLYDARLEFVASEREPCLYVLKRKNSTRRLILDERNNVLQLIAPPFVLNVGNPKTESRVLYPVNHLARKFLMRCYARPLLRLHNSGHSNMEHKEIRLLCGACRAQLLSKRNFHFQRYDIRANTTEKYHVVRVMNLLNRSYFEDSELRTAIRNVNHSLDDGGLFITGSNTTRESEINGSIYKKTSGRFEMLTMSGSGSPIDNLIRATAVEPEKVYARHHTWSKH